MASLNDLRQITLICDLVFSSVGGDDYSAYLIDLYIF